MVTKKSNPKREERASLKEKKRKTYLEKCGYLFSWVRFFLGTFSFGATLDIRHTSTFFLFLGVVHVFIAESKIK